MFYLISVFTIITQEVYSVLIYDVTVVKISKFGSIYQELQLKYINMFERPLTWRKSCESKSENDNHRNQQCDVLVYGIFCNLLNSTRRSSYNLYTIERDTRPVNTFDQYPELNCGNVNRFYVGDEKDYKIYNENECPVIGVYTNKNFKEFFLWQIGVYDWGYFGLATKLWFEILEYSSVPVASYYNVKYKLQTELKAYYKMIYRFVGKCDAHHYGSTCWFACKDNYRRICNCQHKENYTSVNCKPNCQFGWISTFIIYDLGDVKRPMTDCVIKDICTGTSVCNNKECFQMTNKTFKCYYIYPFITVENIVGNYTSDVILYNDVASINISLSLIDNKNLHINYTITLSRNTFVFTHNIFEYMDGYSNPHFKVKDDTFIDKKYELYITFYYFAWMKKIKRLKNFRIYVNPYKINIISTDLNIYVKRHVYLGENIFCNSTSKPNYRTIERWKSSIKFPFHFSTKQKIPINTPLGPHFLYCQLELIIWGRSNSKNELRLKPYIKPHVSFGWNITENILIKNDRPLCSSIAFINYNIKIYQVEGKDSLTFKNNLIYLNNVGGGFYKVICYWDNGGFIHDFQTLKFHLHSNLSFGCFLLHPDIPGTIVQCGHDAHFYDDYRVIVKIIAILDVGLKVYEQHNYLRIPYIIRGLYFICQCQIRSNKFEIDDFVINQTFKMSHDIVGVYSFTDKSRKCPGYVHYVEPQDLTVMGPTTVKINHLLFYFTLSNDPIPYVLFLLFIFFTFPTVMIVIFVLFYLKSTKEMSAPKAIKDCIRMLKMRKFNDSLYILSNNVLETPQLENINLFKLHDDEMSPDLGHI